MSEQPLEKAKKPGKSGRSRTHVHVHYYENLNKPVHHAETPAAVGSLPDGDDDDLTPAQAEVGKKAGSAEKAIEAAGSYTFPGGRNPADRVSPGLTGGHQSLSSGDHGAGIDPMAVPGARELAFRHPASRAGAATSMDLSTHTPFPLSTMRTVNGDNEGDRDITHGVGQVGLSRLDAAGATGMHAAPGNPVSRPLDHIARNSATAPTPGHSLADPRSHAAPQAAKAMTASEARATLKRFMFPGSGGGGR